MKKQQGFTLIELIMVIVVLGILSAFALPRFVDFSGQASTAALDGALGSIKSSSAIAHASCLADASCDASAATDTTDMEISINMVFGYPAGDDGAGAADNSGIVGAASLEGFGLQVSTSITGTAGNTGLIITNNATFTDDEGCVFYIEAADATTAPVIGLGTIANSSTPATASCTS